MPRDDALPPHNPNHSPRPLLGLRGCSGAKHRHETHLLIPHSFHIEQRLVQGIPPVTSVRAKLAQCGSTALLQLDTGTEGGGSCLQEQGYHCFLHALQNHSISPKASLIFCAEAAHKTHLCQGPVCFHSASTKSLHIHQHVPTPAFSSCCVKSNLTLKIYFITQLKKNPQTRRALAR